MHYFVEVIVPLALDPTFTYRINEVEFDFIQVGMRVAVPFGRNKVYTALVVEKHHRQPALYEAKDIHEIIDIEPVVTVEQIKFWTWLAEYYMCTLGDVYKGAMPSQLLLESETIIQWNDKAEIKSEELDDAEYLLYEAMQIQSILKIDEVIAILNRKKVFPVINSLLTKGAILLQEEMVEKYKPKQIRYVRLAEEYVQEDGLTKLMELVNRATKQRELVLKYFQLQATQKKDVSVKQLIEEGESSQAIVNALLEKGIFESYYLNHDRVVFNDATSGGIQLTDEQSKALWEIEQQFKEKEVVLLHGVTASGKTEVYIKLIEKLLAQEGQVLFLLPEVGISTQLVQRLTAYFGNQVAVYHSRYSHNERLEVWNQVLQQSEKAKVVIGTRLSVFLPFQDLRLVVIDEEHDANYKQHDPAPRYHGRDAAVVLAMQHKAKVLMGSATPSLESYYNASQKKYGLVELTKRYTNVLLPEIVLVDIKDKYKRKQMTGHFSDQLIDEINQALSLEEQVILFQNRRGFSPVVECMTCGAVPECPHCDVSLTYHKYRNELRCHYCGYTLPMPKQCGRCHSVDLNTKGFGTEQVEEELRALFPNKRIARMDQDTTRGKYAYEKLIEAFENKQIDILVGTQMLAKGFDFDNVNLVGIMNADNSLYHPDFRAHERAFQMMTQIAGRSGRFDKKGRVVIQTFNPYHNIIQQVTNYDYKSMYKEQMYERHNFQYPPFYRLIRLTLKHRDFEKLKESSFWLYNNLKGQLGIPVLGPEEPAINRIRNQYIRVILIKIPQQVMLNQTKGQVRRILKSFESIGAYRSVHVVANVDFY
ncbi:primosomal protein N' [Myroides sp. 1354]|uniref:replication restart helicase PriA n=1 Tax=unclassified Myroides TaxID=2642485 RepID=UPI002577F3BA|nr:MULTISPECIES: primosomal protein N' [unclassified Myroides]MDM1046513.1 primosomal protein N' [Myroides sp. R163-1]MDM1057429.1 primosomal protein N' [Myroides sp. 1354]MDM1070714.1 primosomal protein N' [Myroides sp. 1372]